MHSSSGIKPYLALVPYLYSVHTRVHGLRDHLANAVTAWVPGMILLIFLRDLGFASAVFHYFVGFAAFISLYEIGYLMNDTMGLRRDVVARDRLGYRVKRGYIFLFAVIRIALFLAIVITTGLGEHPGYLVACAALAAVILAHNTVPQVELKFASFLQMSVLRFFLPIYPGLLLGGSGSAALVVLATGVFCFSYPRLLTYQESKDRLSLPERRKPWFHFQSMALTLPAVLTIVGLSSQIAPLIVWAWLCFVGLAAAKQP